MSRLLGQQSLLSAGVRRAMLLMMVALATMQPRPLLGQPSDDRRVAVLLGPQSCPAETLVANLQVLDMSVDVVERTSDERPFALHGADQLDAGGSRAVVAVNRDKSGLVVHVLLQGASLPVEMSAGDVDCEAASLMAALYVNRCLALRDSETRPLPELKLSAVSLPEVPALPGGSPESPMPLAERGPAIGLQAVATSQLGISEDSPGLLGLEARFALLWEETLTLDIGLGGAFFAGPTDAESGLGGGSQSLSMHAAYCWRTSLFSLAPMLGIGLSNYTMHLDGGSVEANNVLPRMELGLQFRIRTWPEVLAEVSSVWEPWTITAYSEEKRQTWPVGGFALVLRLGASFTLP